MTREMSNIIDRTGSLDEGSGWLVRVRVLDVRFAFGRVDLLVTPINGSGQRWVSLSRVKMQPECPT
jgi:hypothetical protein